MTDKPANSTRRSASPATPSQYALALHGGAGSAPARLSTEHAQQYHDALAAALREGQTLLAAGGTALDCVEQVVRLLEDEPLFNAGRGAVLNIDGEAELDAAIMDGHKSACGAVAAVRSVRNPISLARRVMEQTSHILLVGDGAEQFAQQQGVERVGPEYFRTPRRVEQWNAARQVRLAGQGSEEDGSLGTVGCVALDQHGNLAAATSTGGMTLKQLGRVGDSPLIGAGTYADNATCAVSCTGKGEDFIRYVAAYDISAQMRYQGRSLAEAAAQLVEHRLPTDAGGLIAVDGQGELVLEFNSPGMYRGAADSTGRFETGLGR